MITMITWTRIQNASIVNCVHMVEKIAIPRESTTTLKARRRLDFQMNRSNVLISILSSTKSFATTLANESLNALVNSSNVASETASLTEHLITLTTRMLRWSILVFHFNVIAQTRFVSESSQTNRTLRSIVTIDALLLVVEQEIEIKFT
jgi:hypothetical protein